MKIKPRINDYGHKVADCPFCDGWVYVRESTSVSPDPLRDLKRHITNQAKNEAFAIAILKPGEPVVIERKHLDYYKDHTAVRPVQPVVVAKRQYDGDLTL